MAAAETVASRRRRPARRRRSGRHSWPLVDRDQRSSASPRSCRCCSWLRPRSARRPTGRTRRSACRRRSRSARSSGRGRAPTSGVYFRNSVIVTSATVVLSRRQRDARGLLLLEAPLAPLGQRSTCSCSPGSPIPPLLMMVPIYVEMVQLGLLDTYGSVIFLYTALEPPVQRLSDDGLLPLGAGRADRGRADRRRRASTALPPDPAAARQARASRRWSSSTSSGRGTSSCSRC